MNALFYELPLEEISTFIDRNGIVTRPESEPVIVAPTTTRRSEKGWARY